MAPICPCVKTPNKTVEDNGCPASAISGSGFIVSPRFVRCRLTAPVPHLLRSRKVESRSSISD